MKQISFKIALIVIIFTRFAPTSSAQDLTAQADSAYTAGDYEKALTLYSNEVKQSGTSASLLYNMGNCNYRLGHLALAAVNYERSLRLDPSNENTRLNLELVNSKLIDKKGYDESFLSRTMTDITNIMSSNAWAWTALALFFLTVCTAAVYLFSSGVTLRKIGFFSGGITFILTVIAIIFAISAYRIATATDKAIVISPSTILSTSPRQPQGSNEEAMLLHEGAKVTILDSISSPTDSVKTTWYDVRFDNDHRAWINSKDVEII